MDQIGPILIVSNEPETVGNASTPINLYRCEIPLQAGVNPVRLYFWHQNGHTSTQYYNVLLSLSSGTGDLTTYRAEEPMGSVIERGVCLAKTHLFGSWDDPFDDVSLSATEVSIWETSRSAGDLAAMVMEFYVDLESARTLKVRTTCANSSGIQSSFSTDPPAIPGGPHAVRGSWPYSGIELDCGYWDAKPVVGPNVKKVGVCEAGGPEHLESGFEHQGNTADEFGTDNQGCYGVDLTYRLRNTGTQSYPCYEYAHSRNITDVAAGAIAVTAPSGYFQRGVNFLRGADDLHFCRLTCASNGNEAPFSVPPDPDMDVVNRIAIAGGSGTPFNLQLLGVAIAPNEGGA